MKGHRRSDAIIPSITMNHAWSFDGNNPYEDAFEDSLLSEISESLLSDVVDLTLRRIQRNPRIGSPVLIKEEPVYIVKTAETSAASAHVPPLLIAYTLDS